MAALPRLQPLLLASITLQLFFYVGLTFVGLDLCYSSSSIKELEYNYTGHPSTRNCSYVLTNFYQNNWWYGVCCDNAQLSGLPSTLYHPVNGLIPCTTCLSRTLQRHHQQPLQ
ncbi:hypothetical protein P7K49_038974 [Saguinus oedipus]|uniref:Uncharacterized protein n=1 Tax=Saguinus oedipus TaxID=9490 RepID=A0ABQ9TH29_SAGOE|nr:hypothetical protein P7K49_038974 [Saguinus oedipus]